MASLAASVCAQTPCAPTPVYSICELVFELDEAERKANPNPYATVDLRAEMRSPRHRTLLLHGFWDGGVRIVVRFSPIDPGEWEYRISSNLPRFDNVQGKVTATESEAPGFIFARNVHHWSYTENDRPHLWMGDTVYHFATVPRDAFQHLVDVRAEQKFTHIRGLALGNHDAAKGFATPDQPDAAYFRELDERIRYMNTKGIIVDLILGSDQNHLRKLFPEPAQRERYIRYMVSRYAPFNLTWQIVQEFEEYQDGRELMKELGGLIKQLDAYQHPRSTHTVATSAPLLGDGWMDHILYQSSDDNLGAVERQLYTVPAVNTEFAYEDSGAGRTHPHHVDTGEFRRRLWNSTMNGQYPTYGNTGTYGGRRGVFDPKYLEAPGALQMTVWFNFFAGTRYWELEPYFDLDGGRAVALPGTEYIIYVDKPSGPVEVRVEKHRYDVRWFNPVTGEYAARKEMNSDKIVAEPPDREHDWVLHISREGRKQSMLRSYKFESRRVLMQEVENVVSKIPFQITLPAGDEIRVTPPPMYEAKLTKQTRGTRRMMYLWTLEVPSEGQGYRLAGSGAAGTLRIARGLIHSSPAVLNLRLHGLNAFGKLYVLDRVYRVAQ